MTAGTTTTVKEKNMTNRSPPQHTPAPWHFERYGDFFKVCDEQGVTVADVPENPLDPAPWARSNARLIAAAPDMDKALSKSIQHIVHLCDMVNTYSKQLGLGKKVRAEDFCEPAQLAISKARGRT
jgi:hypothetical protein